MKLIECGLTKEGVKSLVRQYMIETYERYDFVAEVADGMYLYDETGQPYLDFYAGIAVNSVGSCNPHVVEAVIDQVRDVMHTFNYPYTIPQALLAKTICESIDMDKIFFQNSGTEANEAMIKLARKYGIEHYGPERYDIVTAYRSFHGRTLGSLAATGQPETACQAGFGEMVPGFTYARYNDLQSFREAVSDSTIAIMVEPVQGEGGIVPATMEFMRGLRELCDERHILLLLDEVQSGWCRTGEIMAYMHYDIQPDIVSMAKAMGGGMPIGAICAKAEYAAAFSPGSHGSTFGGNPVSCAASLAAVRQLLDEDMAGNAQAMGSYLMQKLQALPHVKEVRGMGLMIGIEFDETVDDVAVKHACFDRKLLVTALGNHVVRLVPPLIVEKKQCDAACDILYDAVSDLMEEKLDVAR